MPLRKFQRGFTMIELMIALVVGLVVSGAALALVASIVKSNSETIRAARLTQELRTTTEVIARELRRARSVRDPIADINASGQDNACNTIDTNTTGCIKIGYDCSCTDHSSATNCTNSTSGTFKTIALVGNSVKLLSSTTAPAACPTAGTGIQISSNSVALTTTTGLKFSPVAASDSTDTDYTINLTGTLTYQPTVSNSVTLAAVSRSYTQHVRIRSAAVQ
jgi:prepilin-type N-terminal cleavage/methylation domain-containing protein